MSQKKSTPKPPQKSRESKLRSDALLLFNTIHDERISADVRNVVEEYVQDIYTDVPETWAANNKPVFVMGFIKGWQRKDTAYARRNVKEMLDRLKKGESAESIIREWEAEREESRAQAELEFLNSPEPKDKNSNEWRYWKLRQMESSFRGEGGDVEKRAAWREFQQIARQAIKLATFDRYHAEMMLPHFLIAIQQKGGPR
jgi:hypothetical protein